MTTLTNIQYIKNKLGEPEYAIVPIKVFKELTQTASLQAVPHAVVGKTLIEGLSPIKAWREHLGFTQTEVAERMGISQAAFSQMENAKRISRNTRKKIATALGIESDLLDI